MSLPDRLQSFFSAQAPTAAGDRILVAFSGGADSTALLWGLARVAAALGIVPLAAHLDHGLDPGSRGRAAAAADRARQLGVELVSERRPVEAGGDGIEAAARRARYRFLEEVRHAVGAAWIATAHQRDDQVETVLLRLRFGSGLAGLRGIPRRRGRVVRPLLSTPRREIVETLDAAGLDWVEDPTNRLPERPRNRLRHVVLPRLVAADPALPRAAVTLADAAAAAAASVESRLAALLAPRREADGASIDRPALGELPPPLLPSALALLQRTAGAPYPPGEAARDELRRQLSAAERVGCDCGDGWRWEGIGDRLHLVELPDPPGRFAYSLRVPGELTIPELALRLRIVRRPVARWMFRGSPRRAGLALPIGRGDAVTVRNRRPGDRLRPLGAPGHRLLKDVLIDRRVPRHQRDRLPLLCLGDRIAWVPGVTIDHRFRLGSEESAWVAALSDPGGRP